MPLKAQISAGGGESPPAPNGNAPEDSLPINDYVPLFFVFGIVIGAYFISNSTLLVKYAHFTDIFS